MRSNLNRTSPAEYYDMFYNGGKHEAECQTISMDSIIIPPTKRESILDIC